MAKQSDSLNWLIRTAGKQFKKQKGQVSTFDKQWKKGDVLK